MNCLYPLAITTHEVLVPCGQCKNCLIARRRDWTTRMMLEAQDYKKRGLATAFITLTYSDEHVPIDEQGRLVLDKKDLIKFLKRIRIKFSRSGITHKLRFYAVGEYGENGTQRPHYHIILFGFDRFNKLHKQLLYSAWKFGRIDVGSCTEQSISYCTYYTSKKMHKFNDKRLDGRPPEFCSMSRNPGIAFFFVEQYVRVIRREKNHVFKNIKIAGKAYSLPFYLRKKIKAFCEDYLPNISFNKVSSAAVEGYNLACRNFIDKFGHFRFRYLTFRANFASFKHIGAYADTSTAIEFSRKYDLFNRSKIRKL